MPLDKKTILFDKSVVVGLSYKDFQNLTEYFSPFITPPLIHELNGELGKIGDVDRFKDKLRLLATKCFTSYPKTINFYTNFLLADLMGESIRLDGRVPKDRGYLIKHKDGTTLYFIEEYEEVKLLRRWSEGKFSNSDIIIGQDIEKVKEIFRIIPESVKREDKDLNIYLKNITNINELGNFVDKILSDYEAKNPKKIIKDVYNMYFSHLNIKFSYLDEILQKWEDAGSAPLSQYAKYAFYCIRLLKIYIYGIVCNLIPTSQSQNTFFDLQYLYYLPFCNFFSSDDKFHKGISPILLRDDQKFVSKEDLRRESSFIKNQEKQKQFSQKIFSIKEATSKIRSKFQSKKNKKRSDKLLNSLLYRVNEGIRVDTGKSLKRGKLTKKYDRLTLKEKSLELIDKIDSMFELQKRKNNWGYVKKDLNPSHVKEFYDLYGDIWRPDSNIYKYYEPKKYSSFALMNCFGTNKIMINNIFSLNINFDGFYIFDFFKNPWIVNRKFNPIANSNLYLADILKDIFVIFILQHLIRFDCVRILPIPSDFIEELRKDMLFFGEKIKNSVKIPSEDEKFIKEKSKEMFLSHAARHLNIKEYFKNNKDYHLLKKGLLKGDNKNTDIDQMMTDYFKFLRANDPFILDQNFSKEELITEKGGTPEMTYMISRLKGIPIITDRKLVAESIMKSDCVEDSNIWSNFMNKINNYKFKIVHGYDSLIRSDPFFDILMKKSVFREFHIFLRDVFYYAVYCGYDKDNVNRLTQDLSTQLQMLDEQWAVFENALRNNNKKPEKYIKSITMHFTIRPEGFRIPKADEWIEKYMKDMNVQKSTTLIYIDSDIYI